MATISVTVDGGQAFRAKMRRYGEALDRGLERGVDKGAREVGSAIRENLRRKTHPVGTPTNSLPGEPPALVTGHLNRSLKHRRARRLRPHVFEAATGPTAVYARIQEKGGRTGRNHATTLPKRPYVKPAVKVARPRVRAIIKREVNAALREVH